MMSENVRCILCSTAYLAFTDKLICKGSGLAAWASLHMECTLWHNEKKSGGRRKKRGKKESSGRARHPAGQRELASSKSTVWTPPHPRTPTPSRPLAPSLAGPSSGLKGQFMSGKEVSGSPSLLKVTSIQQHLTHTAGPASQPAIMGGVGRVGVLEIGHGQTSGKALGVLTKEQGKDWECLPKSKFS